MSRQIKNLEKVYDILVKCRKAFSDLHGDTIIELRKLNRLCIEIDKIIDNKENKSEDKHE